MKRIYCVLAISVLMVMLLTGCDFYEDQSSEFYWIPEESYFAGYEIVDDKVVFAYSICFVNDGEEDYAASVSAKFKRSELSGWVEYKDFFLGSAEDETVKAGTKKNIVYYYEGKYLGGEVNTNLSFPQEMIVESYFPQT